RTRAGTLWEEGHGASAVAPGLRAGTLARFSHEPELLRAVDDAAAAHLEAPRDLGEIAARLVDQAHQLLALTARARAPGRADAGRRLLEERLDVAALDARA